MTTRFIPCAALAMAVAAGSGCGSSDDPADPLATAGAGGTASTTGGATAVTAGTMAGSGGTTGGTMTAAAGASAAGASGVGASGANAAGTGAGTGADVTEQGGTAANAPTVDTSCNIDASVTMSTAISTVGTVELSTDLEGVDGGYIEFGLDGAFDMQAPIDPAQPSYRTVLWGMKPEREYQYRVVVTAGNQRCTGPEQSLQTGGIPSSMNLRAIRVDTPQPDKVAKGFMLMGGFVNGPAFIVDSDGDYVWWFDPGSVVHVRMSYDAKFIWTQALNWGTGIGAVPEGADPGGSAEVHRISVDGMQHDTYTMAEIGDPTNDFDVAPEGSLILPDINGWADCAMKVTERTADGQLHDIFHVNDAYQSSDCLINAINYWPADDSITFADVANNTVVKVTRGGELQWILNGEHSTFTQGDGIGWIGGIHGQHLLAPDRILIFLNGANPYTSERDPGSTSSTVAEVELDLDAKTATKVWEYDGGLRAIVFGDVQRLPNGNTLVNYGSANEIHEVDPDGNLVQSMGVNGSPPYLTWRSSLYGPPDR